MIEAVRPAVADDVAELVRLQRDAFAAVAELRGGPELLAGVAQPTTEDALRALADRQRVTLVATLDDVLVGVLCGRLEQTTLRLELVWVEPEARELGLGDELLITAMSAGSSLGAEAIEAIALPGDRATKNLYERFGVKARAIIVHRRLDDALQSPSGG